MSIAEDFGFVTAARGAAISDIACTAKMMKKIWRSVRRDGYSYGCEVAISIKQLE